MFSIVMHQQNGNEFLRMSIRPDVLVLALWPQNSEIATAKVTSGRKAAIKFKQEILLLACLELNNSSQPAAEITR